jgi:flagellar motor switch protein FliN/FliY
VSDRTANLRQVLRLEVPVVVRLAERRLRVREVVSLVPGAIIQLDKNADKELDLLINDKQVGSGTAVKVGENFGIRLSYIGDVAARVEAVTAPPAPESAEDQEAADLAAAMLAGQV